MDAITLALIKALGGGGGGSGLPPTGPASAGDVLSLDSNKDPQWAAPSGGGGVMVIHETVSGGTHTLDKTWQEIHDFDGISVVISDTPDGDGTMRKFDSVINVKDDPAYTVITGDYIEYTASSASGYPACSE